MQSSKRLSAARREIIEAYEIIRQVGGEGNIAQRIAKHLGRTITESTQSNSWIREVIREYREDMRKEDAERNR